MFDYLSMEAAWMCCWVVFGEFYPYLSLLSHVPKHGRTICFRVPPRKRMRVYFVFFILFYQWIESSTQTCIACIRHTTFIGPYNHLSPIHMKSTTTLCLIIIVFITNTNAFYYDLAAYSIQWVIKYIYSTLLPDRIHDFRVNSTKKK